MLFIGIIGYGPRMKLGMREPTPKLLKRCGIGEPVESKDPVHLQLQIEVGTTVPKMRLKIFSIGPPFKILLIRVRTIKPTSALHSFNPGSQY